MEPDPGSAGVGKADITVALLEPHPVQGAAFSLVVDGMNITLNGERKTVPDGITVSGLLAHLGIQHQRVAVELNEAIVKKDRYEATAVKDGDALEVVSFMGGGS